MDKNSFTPKQKTLCEKLLIAIKTTSPFRTIQFRLHQRQTETAAVSRTSSSANVFLMSDSCAQASKQPVVPLLYDATNQKTNPKKHAKPKVSETKAQEKGTVLPVHGNENRIPSLEDSGHAKSAAAESLNIMFSDYINRTKNRFHTAPSMVETVSFKDGSGATERRLKK